MVDWVSEVALPAEEEMRQEAKQQFRQVMLDALHEGLVTVEFLKADGTTRVMKCTLSDELMPQMEQKESTRKKNDDVLVVWDLEKDGWRSFRLDSVIDYA